MKRFGYVIVALCFGVAMSCSSAKDRVVTEEQKKELETLVNNKTFEFKARWARPLVTSSLNSVANAGLIQQGSTINNVDLTGNANFLKMTGDSVSAYFPYYGERQIGGAYPPTDNAIKFEGIPEDLKVDQNSKGYQIRFNISNKTETYQVTAQLFPNKNGNININSTHRLPISYVGTVSSTTSE
ncbi:DUF4251 domain-containing protein [Flagellimonas sp.]|uniref:DUF4251 domain-containing protein n=1 Tax=Flagellimonas sp. TaxID=2058762 RepID=UPI003F4A0F25